VLALTVVVVCPVDGGLGNVDAVDVTAHVGKQLQRDVMAERLVSSVCGLKVAKLNCTETEMRRDEFWMRSKDPSLEGAQRTARLVSPLTAALGRITGEACVPQVSNHVQVAHFKGRAVDKVAATGKEETPKL
jgi:hypothetical protein